MLTLDSETDTEVEAKVMVIGYDLFDENATTVMVNIVYPRGYVQKKLYSEEELDQMKLKASKLFKSLA